MRFELAGPALSFELGDWSVPEVPQDAAPGFGMYLSAPATVAQLHIRDFSTSVDRSPAGLVALLRAQWASKPTDEQIDSSGDMTIVGGTFDTTLNERFECVREWFVTNGERIANVALIGPRPAVESRIRAAAQLVASIRFSA